MFGLRGDIYENKEKYTYSYLFVVTVVTYCLHFYRKSYIPIVSSYLTNQFNGILFLLFVILIFCIYFIYIRMDIGGDFDEVNSN